MKSIFLPFLLLSTLLLSAEGPKNVQPPNGLFMAMEAGAGHAQFNLEKEDRRYRDDFFVWPSVKFLLGYRYREHSLRISWLYESFEDLETIDIVSLGYRYDFLNIPIAHHTGVTLYPLFSFDFGYARAHKRDVRSWNSELGAGIVWMLASHLSISVLYARQLMFWQSNEYDEISMRQIDNNIFRIGIGYGFGGSD